MRQVQRLPLLPGINLDDELDLHFTFLDLSNWCLMPPLKTYYGDDLEEQKFSFFVDDHRYAFFPTLQLNGEDAIATLRDLWVKNGQTIKYEVYRFVIAPRYHRGPVLSHNSR